jgi:hypothetical protein
MVAYSQNTINEMFHGVMILWASGALFSEVNDEFFSFFCFDVAYRFFP